MTNTSGNPDTSHMTSREELREAARKLGAMMAEHVGDFYDVVENLAAGYAEPLSSHLTPETREHKERFIQCQIGALNELQSVSNEVIKWRVDDAREAFMSWQQIGDVLDISRQAAHERFKPEPA